MRIVIKKNNKTLLCVLFLLWLVSELVFSYTLLSRLSLLLFVGVTIVCTAKVYGSCFLTGYALFVAWSFANIATGHAVDKQTAMDMTLTLCLNLLFLVALTGFCAYVNDSKLILGIYKWVIICCSIPCIIGGLIVILQTGARPRKILGINSNEIAMQAAFALIILVNDIWNIRTRRKRIGNLILAAMLMVMILISGSRKGLLIPIIGVYVLICFHRPRKFFVYTTTTLLACGIILVLILNVDTLYDLIGYRVEAVLQYISGKEVEEASLESRAYYLALGWTESWKSPLWGHGLDCFHLLPRTGTYSHSNYVEILYSLGWTGVVLYYFPYARALRQMLTKVSRKGNALAVSAAILIPYLVCDYMNVTYFTRLSLMVPLIVIRRIGEARKNAD